MKKIRIWNTRPIRTRWAGAGGVLGPHRSTAPVADAPTERRGLDGRIGSALRVAATGGGGADDARSGDTRRDGDRRDGRAAEAGRRGRRRRDDRRRGAETRAGAARRPGRRDAGRAGLGRHPYPLRRAGALGPGDDPVVVARGDDGGVRQLRRRLRAGAPRQRDLPDKPDGGGGGHSRGGARRGPRIPLGVVPRISRRARRDGADDGRGRAGPARAAALLRHGRPGRGPRRAPGRGRDRAHGRAAGGGAAAPARSASPLRERRSTGRRTGG